MITKWQQFWTCSKANHKWKKLKWLTADRNSNSISALRHLHKICTSAWYNWLCIITKPQYTASLSHVVTHHNIPAHCCHQY